jgi:hypothetical protein
MPRLLTGFELTTLMAGLSFVLDPLTKYLDGERANDPLPTLVFTLDKSVIVPLIIVGGDFSGIKLPKNAPSNTGSNILS